MKLPSPKCERTVLPKEAFHPQSFRWSHEGAVHLLIGCPKTTSRGGKKVATKWNEKAKVGNQCQVASSSAKAGTAVHNIVVPAQQGRCKASYKRK